MRTPTTRRTTLASVGLAGTLVATGAAGLLAQDEAAPVGEPVVVSFDFEADAQGWVPIVVDLPDGYDPDVGGLAPATEYLVEGTLVMASNMPGEIADEPNSPAEVYVKLGAIDREPEAIVDDEGWLRLNADKGAEAEGGRDAVVLGTIANPELERGEDFRTFALHELSTDEPVRPLSATSTDDGALWLFMGTDSGYPGFTTQFYDAVEMTFTPQ